MADRDASRLFARLITSLKYEDLPAQVVELARKSILDTIGVIVAASGLAHEPREVVELAIEEGGKEESSVLGYGAKLPCYMAAFANGAMSHALDFDDVGMLDGDVWGHVGATSMPAALATAERVGGVSGKELLVAVAVAHEVLFRMGIAGLRGDPSARNDWYFPPLFGTFAATAASGRLLGLNEEQMVNAFGIALTQAAGTKEIGLATRATIRAMYNAFPAKTGVLSCLMAQRGVVATENSLQGKAGFFPVYFRGQYDAARLAGELGTRWESLSLGFKAWCACVHNHRYIDAALQIMKENSVSKDMVKQVTAYTNEYLQSMVGGPLEEKRRPRNAIAAKFSLPFTLAIAVARGWVSLRDYSAEGLKDPEVLALADRVVTQIHPDVGLVRMTTVDGKAYSKQVARPLGSPEKPLTAEQIEAKFRDCVTHSLSPLQPGAADRVIALVRRLEEVSDVREVIRLVAPAGTERVMAGPSPKHANS
ncbi:MAG: MmgE/PrpD family protein [Chloroflexota bacterium]